jgi:hypothetical protein
MKALSCSFPQTSGTRRLSPAEHDFPKEKGSLRRLLGESFFRRLGLFRQKNADCLAESLPL